MFTCQSQKHSTKEIQKQNNGKTKVESQEKSTLKKKRTITSLEVNRSENEVKSKGALQKKKNSTSGHPEKAALLAFFKKEK